jgi:hypothetical protein
LLFLAFSSCVYDSHISLISTESKCHVASSG